MKYTCAATGKKHDKVYIYQISKLLVAQGREWNSLPLGHDEYREIQEVGFEKLIDKYPHVRLWLMEHKWYWHPNRRKWLNRNMK